MKDFRVQETLMGGEPRELVRVTCVSYYRRNDWELAKRNLSRQEIEHIQTWEGIDGVLREARKRETARIPEERSDIPRTVTEGSAERMRDADKSCYAPAHRPESIVSPGAEPKAKDSLPDAQARPLPRTECPPAGERSGSLDEILADPTPREAMLIALIAQVAPVLPSSHFLRSRVRKITHAFSGDAL